jgi:hypothetical protein
MPNWEPNRQDVHWDFSAADEAAAALRRVANILQETAAQREQQAREATAEWQGRYREEFDVHLTKMLRRARELAMEYRDAANKILSASQRAYDEQKRREQERQRWELEKKDEERARRQQGLL